MPIYEETSPGQVAEVNRRLADRVTVIGPPEEEAPAHPVLDTPEWQGIIDRLTSACLQVLDNDTRLGDEVKATLRRALSSGDLGLVPDVWGAPTVTVLDEGDLPTGILPPDYDPDDFSPALMLDLGHLVDEYGLLGVRLALDALENRPLVVSDDGREAIELRNDVMSGDVSVFIAGKAYRLVETL